jgi:hypothetical protein
MPSGFGMDDQGVSLPKTRRPTLRNRTSGPLDELFLNRSIAGTNDRVDELRRLNLGGGFLPAIPGMAPDIEHDAKGQHDEICDRKVVNHQFLRWFYYPLPL